jgi:hypothetical protein
VNLTAGDFAGQLTPQGFCLLERSNTLARIDSPIVAPSFWKVKKYLITKDFTINGLLIVGLRKQGTYANWRVNALWGAQTDPGLS